MINKAVQEIRFKRYHFNEVLMAYIRSCFRETWSKEKYGNTVKYSNILLSRVVDLEFEKKVLSRYEEIVTIQLKKLEYISTLETDLQLLNDVPSNNKDVVII